jgi:hypothetical protein
VLKNAGRSPWKPTFFMIPPISPLMRRDLVEADLVDLVGRHVGRGPELDLRLVIGVAVGSFHTPFAPCDFGRSASIAAIVS